MRVDLVVPFSLCLAACASAPGAASEPILVQVALPGDGPVQWSAPLDRHPQPRTARLGEVIVSGIWTVHFELVPADAEWFTALRKQHDEVRVTWSGYQIATDGRTGYLMDMNGKENAERALAQPPWSTVRGEATR